MKRERTNDYDVIRQGSTIAIVERRSGVASSLILPSDEAREALIKILSEPIASSPTAGKAQVETPEPVATESEPKKTTTTKKKTTTTKK